jgi:hypothetical protein
LSIARSSSNIEDSNNLFLRLRSFKEIIESVNSPQAYCEFFNTVIDNHSYVLDAYHKGNEPIQNVCQKIKGLRFACFESISSFTNDSSSSLDSISSRLNEGVSTRAEMGRNEKTEKASMSVSAAPICEESSSSSSQRQMEMFQLSASLPQDWQEWFHQSLGNKIGMTIRLCDVTLMTYPIKGEDVNRLEIFISELSTFKQQHHRYFHCIDTLCTTFHSLQKIQTQQEAKQILTRLIHQDPLRSVIIAEIRPAIHPIMRYLAGKEKFDSLQIIVKIRDFQNVLRRWGLIEKNHLFDSQSDAMECLQSLFDFIQEPGDVYSDRSEGELIWNATLDSVEEHWICEDIDLKSENEKKSIVFHKLIKSAWGAKINQLSQEDQEKMGKAILDQIITAGIVKDGNEQEIEDLPSLEEVLKPHCEIHKFPLCFQAFVKEGNLVPANCLDKMLSSCFKDVESFVGYRILKGGIQKVTVPVLEISTIFKGKPPRSLLLQPTAIFKNQQTDLPEINIPPTITFAEFSYVLTKCAARTGNQHIGHYTFWTLGPDGKSLYADSLDAKGFISSNVPLHEQISGKKNVTLLEYQRTDIPSTHYLTQQKLYQSEDHLCYIIEALYFIFGNSCFSSINQMTPPPSVLPDIYFNHQSLQPQKIELQVDKDAFALIDLVQIAVNCEKMITTETPKKRKAEKPLSSNSATKKKRSQS